MAILGLSYFFIQFGPNMTTFVLPSEVFPVSMRTTGHGVAAGVGKLGAFVGVFLVPVLQDHIGLRGLLAVAGVSAVLGFAVTRPPSRTGRTISAKMSQRMAFTRVTPDGPSCPGVRSDEPGAEDRITHAERRHIVSVLGDLARSQSRRSRVNAA